MALPDTSDIDTYGGELINEAPIANPNTDLEADSWNKVICDVGAMTGTAWRAWALVTLAATTGAMAIVSHGSNWGSELAVRPTPTRTSQGLYVLTWPATVVDDLGDSHTLNFRAGAVPSIHSATFYVGQMVSLVANVVTFKTWDTANAVVDPAGINALIMVL